MRRGLVLVAVMLGEGCIVDDPEYLGPTTSSDDSAGPTGSGTTTPDTTTPDATTPGTTTSGNTGCEDLAGGWWDEGWPYRRRLDFDNSGQPQDLLDFTVLVVLAPASFDYTRAAPDGADLRFVDGDEASVLAHHVERWDPEGESYLWVKVPAIDASSTDDHVWLYYGNPGAPDLQDPAGSWDDAHVGVWHLEESAGAHFDSTVGISCDWQGGGGGSQDAVGRIAGAVDFDGDQNRLDCGINQIEDTTSHTITAWVRLDLLGDDNQQIVTVESTINPFRGIGLAVQRDDGAVGKWLDSGYDYAADPANQVEADVWSFVALRGHRANLGGFVEVSRDGGPWERVIEGNTNGLAIADDTALMIGGWEGLMETRRTQGSIDEVRISNVVRSAEWVRAQYLSDTEQLVTIEGEQPLCP